MQKIRLDLLLLEHKLAPTRERAKALIMEGLVFVDEERVDKAGQLVSKDAQITVKGTLRYVSRGGLKLEKLIQKKGIRLERCVCMDVGASTGGFTDCMLQNGAKKVYAVDVGYGQLAWKLRNDSRVVNLERTNARHITAGQMDEPIDFASVDVSFISLKLILPALYPLLKDHARLVTLVKPQFEAGKDQVGKKGVVRDPKVHQTVLETIFRACAALDYAVLDIDFSPIQGPQGNIEYLFYLEKSGHVDVAEKEIPLLVARSHQAFQK